jgi:hypothetical protein
MVYGYYVLPKPSLQGFPTAVDPADRNCRYLVQPPTVPCLARLRGYQRPPRGGGGRCRRACERTPSGAAAAAPPAGAELGDKFLKHYDAVFRVAVCRIFGLPSSRHPASSLLYAPPLFVLLAISRFKLCGVRSRRRARTCRMMRGPLLSRTIWLDAAEMLRSTPLTLG